MEEASTVTVKTTSGYPESYQLLNTLFRDSRYTEGVNIGKWDLDKLRGLVWADQPQGFTVG